jgi:serine/threonine-protein kinase
MTYEMLVGDPPFTGSTAQAIVAKVMTERPRPLHPQRDTVPPAVEEAVLTALEKLPADRYATAAQFAEALQGRAASARTRVAYGARSTGWRARLRDPLVLALAATALAAAVAAGWLARRRPSPGEVVRFTLAGPPSGRTASLGYNILGVSPDGHMLVYPGLSPDQRQLLVLRSLDETAERPLSGTEDGGQPIFSPDGRWVAFIRSNQLYKVPVDGNAPQLLGTAPGTFNGASWSASGVIVVSGNTALYSFPEGGGAPRLLGTSGKVPGEVYRDAPLVLDAARVVAYSSWSGSSLATAKLALTSLETGETTVLDLPGIAPLGLVDGTLVYATAAGLIMGVPCDPARRRVLGPPVQLVDNVAFNVGTGLALAAMSPRTLFYQSGSQLSQVVVAGPGGPSRLLLADRRDYAFPRLSPDGRTLAITLGAAGRRDVWLDDLDSGTLTRLTTEGASNERPEWSPDGRRVLYRTDRAARTAIWWRPVDLSADATPLVSGDRADVFEAVVSPDGRYVAYQLDTLGADVYYRSRSGDTAPRPIAASNTAIENMPRISPDGRWIAFVTDESGRNEVVVQPFPGPGGRIQVSVAGGTEPVWSRDGRRLFYRGDGYLMAARLRPGEGFGVAARDTVLRDTYVFAGNPHANYDVMPDGEHFVMLQGTGTGEMVVVSNWESVVRGRMAAR